MYLRKENLYIVAGLMGYEDLTGLDYTERDIDDSYAEVLWDELLDSGMLDFYDDEICKISDLGQYIINTIVNPEICIHIENRNSNKLRNIYIRDYRYMYVEETDNVISIDFLLTIDTIIGAVADAIDTQSSLEPDFSIEGSSDIDTFTIEFYKAPEGFRMQNGNSSVVDYSETDCLNDVTEWMFQMMKKGERDE